MALEQDVRAVFDSAPGIAAVYLFGSAARGELRAESDIDVGVLFETPPPSTLDGQPYDMEAELERRVGRRVEIVVLNNAPADLSIRVLRAGGLIVDRNRSARIAFEVRTRNAAFDLELFLQRYRGVGGSPPMTDPQLVAKKLALIESCVADLRRLARLDELERDVRERRFIEHTLQIAIQAALDVASHISSDQRLGEPRTSRELFDLLERANWIPATLGATLRRMVGFRNVVVHGYDEVDLDVVRDIVEHRLGDLMEFAATIRKRLGA